MFFHTDFSLLDPVGAPTVVADATSNDSNQAWRIQQPPQVLGYTQDARITVHEAADGPAASNPSRYLRFELRSEHNADRTITLAAGATATDTSLSVTGDLSGVNPGDNSAFMLHDVTGERVRLAGIVDNGAGSYTITVRRARQGGSGAQALSSGSTFTLWGGDVNPAGGSEYASSRCEVYNKSSQWYHFGSWTYIGFWLLLDSTITLPSGTEWMECSQVSKGDKGGSPVVAFGIEDGRFRIASLPTGSPQRDLGVAELGVWHYWQVGVLHHTDATQGRVAVWKDGTQIGEWTQATIELVNGAPDSVYNKVGCYRAGAVTGTYVLYFGEVKNGWTLADVAQDALVASATGERAPFAATSQWNKSLADVYGSVAAVPIHPDSDLLIESLRRQIDFSTGALQTGRYMFFRSDVTQFTPAVWIVQPGWTYQTVQFLGVKGESSDASTTMTTGGGTIQVPLPADLTTIHSTPPAYATSSGTDAQMTIWDRDNIMGHPDGPQFWDGWQWHSDASNVLVVNASGQPIVQNISHFTGEATSSGVPGNTPDAYVSRGAGTPYMAGHLFARELAAAAAAESYIPHALALAYSSPAGLYVPVASKSDGAGPSAADVTAGDPYSMPEGTRIFLDSRFDVASLPTAEERAWARTMQIMGGRVIDNTGNPKTFLEAQVSANDGAGWTSVPPADLLKLIPFEQMHVVDWEGGNSGRTSATTGFGTGTVDFTAKLTGGIAGTPAVLGVVAGSSVTGNTVATASQTPNADELILAVGAIKTTNDRYFSAMDGNGMSRGWQAGQFRPYARHALHAQNGNGMLEAHAGRAPAGVSAGALTGTHTAVAGASAVLQAIRLTALAKPVRVVVNEVTTVDSANPSVTMKQVAAGSLLIGLVHQRFGTVSSVDAAAGAWTLVGTVVGGTSPELVRLTTYSLAPAAGDVTFAPTLSQATEWTLMLIEIT